MKAIQMQHFIRCYNVKSEAVAPWDWEHRLSCSGPRQGPQAGSIPVPHQEQGTRGTGQPQHPPWGGWGPAMGPAGCGAYPGRAGLCGAGAQPCCGLAGAGSSSLRAAMGPWHGLGPGPGQRPVRLVAPLEKKLLYLVVT